MKLNFKSFLNKVESVAELASDAEESWIINVNLWTLKIGK